MGQCNTSNPAQLGCPDDGRLNQDYSWRFSNLDGFPPFGESPDVTYLPPEDASKWTIHKQPDFFMLSAAKAIEALGDPAGPLLDSDSVMEMFPIEMCHENVSSYRGDMVSYRRMSFDIDTGEHHRRVYESLGFSPNSRTEYIWTTRMMRDCDQFGGPLYSVPTEIWIRQQIGVGDRVTEHSLKIDFRDPKDPLRVSSVPFDRITCSHSFDIRKHVAQTAWMIGIDDISNIPFFLDNRIIQGPYSPIFFGSREAKANYQVRFEPFPKNCTVMVLYAKQDSFGDPDLFTDVRHLIECLPPDTEAMIQFVKLMDTRFQSEDY